MSLVRNAAPRRGAFRIPLQPMQQKKSLPPQWQIRSDERAMSDVFASDAVHHQAASFTAVYGALSNPAAGRIALIKAFVCRAIATGAGRLTNRVSMRTRSRHWLVAWKLIGEMPLPEMVRGTAPVFTHGRALATSVGASPRFAQLQQSAADGLHCVFHHFGPPRFRSHHQPGTRCT